MRTTGIGLGRDAAASARCDLDWVAGRAFVKVLVVGVDDDRVVEAVRGSDAAAIAVADDRGAADRLGALLGRLAADPARARLLTVEPDAACATWGVAATGDALLDQAPWLVADGLLPRLAARHPSVTAALVASLVARAEAVGLAHVDPGPHEGAPTASPLARSLPVLHV